MLTDALAIEGIFRSYVSFAPSRSIMDPMWYHKSAAFYAFIPGIEIVIAVMLAVVQADRRFFVDTTPTPSLAGKESRPPSSAGISMMAPEDAGRGAEARDAGEPEKGEEVRHLLAGSGRS